MIGFLLSSSELLAVPGEARTDAELLRDAETAFHAGEQAPSAAAAKDHYRSSADAYEELHRRGFDSTALCRNEGNAFLLAGDLPRAILAYRQGLRLAPHDRLLRANLGYARTQVVYALPDDYGRPFVEWWPFWLPWPGLTGWLVLTALANCALCICCTRWFMTRRLRWLQATIAAFIGTGLCVLAVAAEDWRARGELAHPLVVLAADKVILRKGNGFGYPPRRETPLPRGVEARLLYERSGWLQVILASGEAGWIPRAEALLDKSQETRQRTLAAQR
jgi:tetratricopeptide (TPR) repeat protein